jgi:hypothetical protein
VLKAAAASSRVCALTRQARGLLPLMRKCVLAACRFLLWCPGEQHLQAAAAGGCGLQAVWGRTAAAVSGAAVSHLYRWGVCGGLLVWLLLRGAPCPPCHLAAGRCPVVGGECGPLQGEVAGWGHPVGVGVLLGDELAVVGGQWAAWVCVVVGAVVVVVGVRAHVT